MAELTVQTIAKEGAVLASAASAGGDTFQHHPGNVVMAVNAHATLTRTITIVPVNDPLKTPAAGSLDLPDISIAVAALDVPQLFHVPSAYVNAGVVSMTYSDEADLSVGVGAIG